MMIDNKVFFIPGPVGQLEAKALSSKASAARAIFAVICHPHPMYQGTMDNKVVTTLSRTFAALDIFSVRFNYRGVGQSEGQYANGIGETDDLIAVCRWLKKKAPDHALWLAGFSFGSYVAARAAKQVSAQQLLTIAPAVTNFDFDRLEPPACPWLVVQGLQDEIVAAESVLDWRNRQVSLPELITFPNTGHFFHGELINLKTALIDYYRRQL